MFVVLNNKGKFIYLASDIQKLVDYIVDLTNSMNNESLEQRMNMTYKFEDIFNYLVIYYHIEQDKDYLKDYEKHILTMDDFQMLWENYCENEEKAYESSESESESVVDADNNADNNADNDADNDNAVYAVDLCR
jgi:hypothetical protein